MLQAFTVLPAFALVYLLAAPTGCGAGCGSSVGGRPAIVAAGRLVGGAVALWPAGSRPFIDGSPDNSILNLIFGYNGFSRLVERRGGGGGGAGFSGADRPVPPVQRPDGRPGLLAAAGRPAGPGRRRWSGGAGRPGPTGPGPRCCSGAAGWW